MKFINRFSNKVWNDKSGQSQIRLLNYLFGFIIVISFWGIGQVVNSPSGEAWGNILRIGQLPIWLTMCSNNNNGPCDCETLRANLASAASAYGNKLDDFAQLCEERAKVCDPSVCATERQAVVDAAKDVSIDSSGILFSIIGLFIDPPLGFVGLVLSVRQGKIDSDDLWAKIQALDACTQPCETINNQLNNMKTDLDQLHGVYLTVETTYTACGCTE